MYYANQCTKGQSLSQPHNNVACREQLIYSMVSYIDGIKSHFIWEFSFYVAERNHIKGFQYPV